MSDPNKQVKAIQISVALGRRQRLMVRVDGRVDRDLCSEPDEHHNGGLTSIHPELIELAAQIFRKLDKALRDRDDSITVYVDGPTVLPDPH